MLCLFSWLVVKSMFQCLWGAVFVFESVFVLVSVFVFARCVCVVCWLWKVCFNVYGARNGAGKGHGANPFVVSPPIQVQHSPFQQFYQNESWNCQKKLCCPMKVWNVHIFVSWSGCLSMAYKVRIWIWNVLQIFFIGRSQPLCKGTYRCLNGLVVVMWWLSNFWY